MGLTPITIQGSQPYGCNDLNYAKQGGALSPAAKRCGDCGRAIFEARVRSKRVYSYSDCSPSTVSITALASISAMACDERRLRCDESM